tara:strand:+ start:5153 stop:6013 length:861 start_codon:yes stop_codon:yes gene_type:complete
MPEETEIDVGDGDEDSIDVNINQETSDDSPVPSGDSDELEQYSVGVKGRINELTKRFREEERQKQTAVEFAENVRKENDSLKQRMEALDKGYMEQFDSRVSTELESAKRVLREAHETGDVDRLVDAQEALAHLTVQKTTSRAAREQADARSAVTKQSAPSPQQAPAAAAPDPKAESWAAQNGWFGNDEVMTYGAFGIHRRLVEDEGFDPSSDDYYAELDSRLRNEFPNKFDSRTKSTGGRKVASAESSASRNQKSGRKTVRLTPSQVAIAKRLNVPLEEYAKYVRD